MIDDLRAKGHSATEIVNHLLLGCEIKSDQIEETMPETSQAEKNVGTPNPYVRGKHKTFSPTLEEIDQGKRLLRESRDAAKLQSGGDSNTATPSAANPADAST